MSEDIEPADLQRDLDRIKDAMGIAERYENAPEQWLLFGVLIAVGCALSQFVVLERLPGYWFFVIWFGLFGAFGGALYWRSDSRSWGPGSEAPNVGFQILVVYAGAFAVQFVTAPFLPDLGYLSMTAYVLGLVLVMLGIAYVVAGETLKAYHIRDRDRYALHAGGALMAGLGIAIPNVEPLHEWGFAAFGPLYLVYATVTYLMLTRT
ncbi:hypothetical protein HALLA_13425 [Halostagnicola larsenii XH-48]|uniref:Uncharacterized protein n=1 Tax=Halostagnicola larsenii XH-48 TaxID=797299 RepID=W0JR37_9EURY|nr:hypothetical protein [Halostagnicola larsenii]AHF99634.1 hypothetical protein HALLA_13425 [Halostagnicola larsenii XH-48]